jgi:hypothetical protein
MTSLRRGIGVLAIAIVTTLLTGCGSADTNAVVSLGLVGQPTTTSPPPNQSVQQVAPPRGMPAPPIGAQPPPPDADLVLQPTGAPPEITTANGASGDVTGGGPQDSAAVARTRAQLPTVGPNYGYRDGVPGYDVVKKMIGLTSAGPVFNTIDSVAECALGQGVFAFRGIGLKNLSSRVGYDPIGGVLVIAADRITPSVLIRCVPVLGGGPGGPQDSSSGPCFNLFRYQINTNGVIETYYVMSLATRQSLCSSIFQAYAPLTPEIIV